MPTIQKAPLSALSISAHNVRRTGKGDVAQLAASILAEGLINPLTVVRVQGDAGERFEVIAGGKRLRAHQLLQERGEIPADHLVDINVIDDTNALEISLAENVVRERMHPHDEFVAFRDLAAAGHGVDAIAARFGVTPLVVQRRLRLANVSPVLLRLFREDKLNVDQMQAFALTEDHTAQERVYNAARSTYDLEPARIRAALAGRQIATTDKRVRFVGLDVYEAAGGAVTRDLFDNAGGGYVADENLLDQLVEERLRREAQALQDEGWSFVQIDRDGRGWQFESKCNRSQPKRMKRELSEPESARLAEAQERLKDVVALIDAEDDREGDDAGAMNPDAFEALLEERETLGSEIRALTAQIEVYSTRQMAGAGCLIAMDYRGALEVTRGLIPRADSKAEAQVAQGSTGEPTPKPAALSEAMLRRFSCHRQVALQRTLLTRADVALRALAHALLLPLAFKDEEWEGDDEIDFEVDPKHLLGLTATATRNDVGSFGFPDVTEGDGARALDREIGEFRDALNMPRKSRLFWPWLVQQSDETVHALLGLAAVLSVSTTLKFAGQVPGGSALETALDLQMSDHWRATAANFGTLVPRAISLEAVREVHGDRELARLEPMKKAELAGAVEQLLAPFAWLPKPLRRADYKTPKPGAPTPTADKAMPKLKTKSPAKAKAAAATKAATKKKPAAKAKPTAKAAKKSTTKARK